MVVLAPCHIERGPSGVGAPEYLHTNTLKDPRPVVTPAPVVTHLRTYASTHSLPLLLSIAGTLRWTPHTCDNKFPSSFCPLPIKLHRKGARALTQAGFIGSIRELSSGMHPGAFLRCFHLPTYKNNRHGLDFVSLKTTRFSKHANLAAPEGNGQPGFTGDAHSKHRPCLSVIDPAGSCHKQYRATPPEPLV